ncbi:hypothetical protein Y032_0068g232 [Ancylostoma ceylanicum]|nr:hypothetical protein Y032_0068g232 [Ancylostoma ceylanicum]
MPPVDLPTASSAPSLRTDCMYFVTTMLSSSFEVASKNEMLVFFVLSLMVSYSWATDCFESVKNLPNLDQLKACAQSPAEQLPQCVGNYFTSVSSDPSNTMGALLNPQTLLDAVKCSVNTL